MKITVIKKSAKDGPMCPWVVEVMDHGKVQDGPMCPWVVEVMDRR